MFRGKTTFFWKNNVFIISSLYIGRETLGLLSFFSLFLGKERRVSRLLLIFFGQVIKTTFNVFIREMGEKLFSERISLIISWRLSERLWQSGKCFSVNVVYTTYYLSKKTLKEFFWKHFLVIFEQWTNKIRLRRVFISGVSKNIFYKSIGTIWEETIHSKTNSSFSSFSNVEHFFPTSLRSFFVGVVKTGYQASIGPFRRKIVFPKIFNFLSSSEVDRKQFGLTRVDFWQG